MNPYTYTAGPLNVSYLDAPYDLLVRAFGREGTLDARDEEKSLASWGVITSHGKVEVYDYSAMSTPPGQPLSELTRWHVQGNKAAVKCMLALLDQAIERDVAAARDAKIANVSGADFGRTVLAGWANPEDGRTAERKREDLAQFLVEAFGQIDDEETLRVTVAALQGSLTGKARPAERAA